MAQFERNEPFLSNLVESFRTLLDESVVTAIASDYELHTKSGFSAAKKVLKSLSQDVVAEENSGFNPTGVTGLQDAESQDTQTATSTTSNSQRFSVYQETNSTSSGSTSDPADATWVAPRVTSFNNDTIADKSLQLHAMFPEMKEFDVKYALKKCNNDFQSALEYLLNMQYLEETGQRTKGIDGFAQFEEPRKQRKGKGKGRKREPSPDTKSSVPAELIREAKEQTDIGYIAERFNITFDAVSETYYDSHCSSPATVLALLDQRLSQDPNLGDDDTTQEAVSLLSRKYKQVPEKYLRCIVSATSSITPFSDDLAQLVSKRFARSKRNKGQKMTLEGAITPLPRDEFEDSTTSSRSNSPNKSARRPLSPSAPAAFATGNFADSIKMSQALHQARRDASASAAQMQRKGGSHGLYRQAAGYYTSQAREHARGAKAATSAAADLLVDQQSHRGSIDLHGVSVPDGTRIARQRATAWWQQLGEYKARAAQTSPLVVITGRGRHSAGGVSQLRRAVAAALLQDGWKVEVGTGNFTISGRR